MRLINEKTKKEVKVGDVVFTKDGEKGTVKYIEVPKHSASEGKIETELGFLYSSVYGCRFIERDDR